MSFQTSSCCEASVCAVLWCLQGGGLQLQSHLFRQIAWLFHLIGKATSNRELALLASTPVQPQLLKKTCPYLSFQFSLLDDFLRRYWPSFSFLNLSKRQRRGLCLKKTNKTAKPKQNKCNKNLTKQTKKATRKTQSTWILNYAAVFCGTWKSNTLIAASILTRASMKCSLLPVIKFW